MSAHGQELSEEHTLSSVGAGMLLILLKNEISMKMVKAPLVAEVSCSHSILLYIQIVLLRVHLCTKFQLDRPHNKVDIID